MEQLNIANGGVQYIPQITAVQYVYLDFDGELTSYNGELLTVENVEVLHSELTEERIENILDELNRKYAAEDVIFVTRRPENVEYSTIYIGKTGDFDAYGSFAGLAETIDTGNQNKADKAFVLLDYTDTNESIIATISHETDHLLGTLNHGGEGIHAYATTYNVASGTTLSNKNLMYKNDTVNVRNSGTVYSITLSGGATMNIYDGGIASKTSIEGGGIMNISSGGIANSTTANGSNSVASMFIYDGGCANYTSVWAYAVMHVKSGGIANYTSIACHGYYSWTGSVAVSNGGIVNDTEMLIDGRENNHRLTVLDGGVANRTTAYAGSVCISSGGTANSTFVYSGAQMYIAGGTANSTVINSGASMHLASGGTASNTFISSGASMYIASGGTALETLENGGYVNVEDGANATFVSNTLNEIVLSNGGMTVHRNTVANSTIVSSRGSIFIYSGGIANSTTATQQGYMYICGGVANSTVLSSSGYMHISSGGLANQTIIKSGGTLHISSGGIANSTTVSSSGKLNISSGATAYLTTVSSGGKINLFGTHTGRMIIRYGGVVSAYSGSIIDFTVAGRTSADDSLISDLSLIIGDPTFTITVSANQADGTYRLARGAEEFTGTITIGDGTTEYGAVTVNGDSLLYNNRFYTLIQNDGNLLLNVNTLPAVFIYSSGTLVSSGGEINNTIISGGGNNLMHISSGGIVNSTTVKSDGEMHISSGGVANSTTVDTYWGLMYISSGGVANNTTVNSWGNVYILGGVANNTTVDHGFMYISSGGVANNTVNENGGMYISSGGVHQGNLIIRNGAWLYAYGGGIIDFTLVDRTAEDAPLINDISRISGTPTYTITVSANQTSGTYKLARGAKYFTGTLTIGDGSVEYGSVEVNGSKLFYNANSYQLKEVKGDLTLTVVVNYVLATANSAEWNFVADSFTAELHRTGVEGSLVLDNITEKSFFTYGMPTGSYQWSVSAANDKGISDLFAVTASGKAEQYIAAQDSRFDLFFGNAKGIWLDGYAAEHTGSTDGWSGTGDKVYLTGKNKIADIFVGSDDANVLVLTDDRNGDALFVDDVYSAFPDEIEAQARIAGINEIRAGAGNDIIDLTSQLFEYVGDGVTIYGGAGNDTIWANSGENILFGDAGNDRIVGGSDNDIIVGGAGNDRMHGGGGSDTFCFGSDWGIDTIEQLADGSVTLWFESGSEEFWNAETLTYSDGANRVTLKGVAADAVTLKFGDVESAIAGAFENAASEKIFEDKSKALIA